MTKIINLYGGPGSGKSTGAALLFSKLKNDGVNAELVTEYAKELVWSESMKVLDNQIYVFAKQYHRIHRLLGKVDVIVTDSPILLSLIYGNTSDTFKKLVQEEYRKFDCIDVFLERTKDYNPKGRTQTEEQAVELDKIIRKMMGENCDEIYLAKGNKEGIKKLYKYVRSEIR